MKTFFTGNSGNSNSNSNSNSSRRRSELNCTGQDVKNENRVNQQANALEQCEQNEHIDGFEKVLVIISVLLFLILNS